MILGAPQEARWSRAIPRGVSDASSLQRVLHRALGLCRVLDCQPLTDGFRNTNLCVRLDIKPGRVVVRFFEHDASLCQKEIDLIRLVGSSVPVPEVIHAESNGWDDLPPYLVMRHVEGVTFRALKRHGDRTALNQALFSIGRTLAAMVARPSRLRAGLLPDLR